MGGRSCGKERRIVFAVRLALLLLFTFTDLQISMGNFEMAPSQRRGLTKMVLYKGFGHAYIDNTGVYPQCEDCIDEMVSFILAHCN